ncbi:hypothetical protein Rumeso_03673 [Rubellimicrobium mesophilum DSM 19309]|uniref:Uncharacterized protein n=1 Tax=Rubellimicrobium mesophilum DSM 19309 TaxID=442562 RepID=A0A017HK65_9RHOB|nr:hypothetical protein [Rubellimicrobium mesophilum]EYD74720.1 hypothetical protein Rumeso_03673 [Rubellimicrobium mesophilum DSM 19309]
MSHIELTKGARYRVLIGSAKLSRLVPCSLAQISETRPLTAGEVITYKDSRFGWGSDPGAEGRVRH